MRTGGTIMLKKFNDFLAGLPMTIVAGVFLLLDLVPQLAEEFGGTPVQISFLPFDPAWVTIVISGIPLLYLAIWRIIHNPGISKISSALLICIAMFAAIAIGDLFAAGEVVFIMAIGALLEEATTNRAKKGLKKLISLAPTKGRRLKDGKEEMIPAEEIRQGDILRILPGETIPVDGTIISGETSVDQSIMTGESLPVDKGVGEEVFCGTINRFGSIDISATKVGENSSLQKLIQSGKLAGSCCLAYRNFGLCIQRKYRYSSHRVGCILPLCPCIGNTYRYYGSNRAGNKAWCDHQVRRSP